MSTMNDRMARVFLVLGMGFVGVVVLLTWWQVVAAGELRAKDYNAQSQFYEQLVRRGVIRTADGTVLARNVAGEADTGDRIYRRRYPEGSFMAHVLGYSSPGRSRAGVERGLNDALTGSTRDLGSLFEDLDSEETVGDDVTLTLRADAQRVAEQALAGSRGSVVVLEPDTGRVLVMAASPAFDPNDVDGRFDTILDAPDAPLINRATQGRYAPGSTFKLVTAVAALEQGVATRSTQFPGGCRVDVEGGGPPVENFGGSCAPSHDLDYALTNSINITFARLGDQLGGDGLREQMERFGFFSRPEVEGLPANELRASGLYDGSDLLDPGAGVDAARVAIGQERLEVSPLQMATVAAAIANDGTLMRPYVVERVTRAGGAVVRRGEPRADRRAMDPDTARTIGEMMTNVVREGTGTAAALEGIDVAGKTGTADTGSGNQVWFVGFAPADNPQVAFAVTLEGRPEGDTGGVVAAPIARDVVEELL